MDVPAIADFPDDLERLAEWRRRKAEEELFLRHRVGDAAKPDVLRRMECNRDGLPLVLCDTGPRFERR